jgi:hypothetical protein
MRNLVGPRNAADIRNAAEILKANPQQKFAVLHILVVPILKPT